MLKVLSNILCDLDPKVKVIGQKAGICDGVPSTPALVNIFNYIWTTGKFPEDWTLATIIPIPKPGKDPAEPNNYRPIA